MSYDSHRHPENYGSVRDLPVDAKTIKNNREYAAKHKALGKKIGVKHDTSEYHLSKTTKRGKGLFKGVSHEK